MNDTKHTQGEWKVKPNLLSKGDFIVDSENGTICRITDADFVTENEAEANAKLIAAAPKMLEVCLDIMKQYLMYDDDKKPECWNELLEVIKSATE